MAKTSLVIKNERRQKALIKSRLAGKKPQFPTKVYNRCKLCGRSRAYMKKFDMCRICFRELAGQGLIMGVKKSSW